LLRLRIFAGAERCSCFSQFVINPFRDGVRAPEHAPCNRINVLERCHRLAQIVERGAGVFVERPRVSPSQPERIFITIAENAPRRGNCLANEAYGVEAGRNVSLLIVYPHFDVKGICSYTFRSGRCPKKYRGFPFFGLADRNAPTSAPAPTHAFGAPGAPAPQIPVLGAIRRPNPAHQPRPFGAARTYAVAPGAFGAPGPPAAAPPPQQVGASTHPNLGGLFAGGNQAVPPKMPRGSAAALGPPGSRDYLAAGSGFSSTYSAFGGGGLGLFASAPGFITTTSRVVDDTTPPGAPGDTTRRSSP
jgi:hypothetical protein